MPDSAPLLVEIGTEELPPAALRPLRDAFRDGLVAALDEARLEPGAAQAFATPRRIAVRLAGVALRQPDREIERRGPALEVAFDEEGRPTRAAEGFARSCGVAVEELGRLETEKGAWLAYRGIEEGRQAAEVLPGLVEQVLARLPQRRRMRWGDGDVEFIRPVHWIVLLHGEETVTGRVLGVTAGRSTRGHRFHHGGPLALSGPEGYEEALREACVIADLDERRARIAEGVAAAAREHDGEAVVEPWLLDEVAALCEWPVPLVGGFDPEFLEVPHEALVSSMQNHQRCFPVRDSSGALMPRFVTVANIESRDPQAVRAGNERVIRPRLADAGFFWDQDRKRPLAERIEDLRGVIFHRGLGTLFDKSRRVARLARELAAALDLDPEPAERAAWLAKADLTTEMVGEFPELQGTMGGHYARHDGEPEAVATAVAEHYRPRFAGDTIPTSAAGQAVAVADRLDTLAGVFAIGKAPSGDKDPFALRRTALGLVRILVEGERALGLREWLGRAAALLPEGQATEGLAERVAAFCHERQRGYYLDQGLAVELLDAVSAVAGDDPLDYHRRVTAIRDFVARAEAEALAAAQKRTANILRRAEPVAAAVDPDAGEPAEQALASALEEARAAAEPQIAGQRYGEALATLARLRAPVDRFFDEVLVMAEDASVRRRRLALLQALHDAFTAVADISRLPQRG